MKSESFQHDSAAEDLRLPPEIISALARHRASPVVVPPERDAAILKEAEAQLHGGGRVKRPQLAIWLVSAAAAVACVALMVGLTRPGSPTPGGAPQVVRQEEDAAAILLREFSALHPNQIKAIIRDDDGIQIELAESAEGPSGQALVLRVCLPHGCKEIITFSGQHIDIAGHPVTVRAEEDGRVILDGGRFVWSSDLKEGEATGIKIESRRL